MAERKHRKRRRRRRGRFGGLYKLLSFLMIFAALLAGSVAFFRVNRVEVTGNSRYTVEEVAAASGVQVGENLLLVNRSLSALAITDQLPYVEKVAVIKRLPDVVELRITESSAVAALEAEGSWWLINENCKFLEQGNAAIRGNLPQLIGITPLAPSVSSWLAVDQTGGETGEAEEGEKGSEAEAGEGESKREGSEQLKLDGLKSLFMALQKREMLGGLSEFIDLTSGNVISFGYSKELTVEVPMSGDFDRRILSLQRTLEAFEQRGERVVGTLDLTYGDNRARLLPNRQFPAGLAAGTGGGAPIPEAGGGDAEPAASVEPEPGTAPDG